MKKIKSIMAILLCVILTGSVMCACSKEEIDEESPFYDASGKWSTTLDLSEGLSAQLNGSIDERIDSFRKEMPVTLTMKLSCVIDKNDCTVKITNESEINDQLDKISTQLKENLIDAVKDYAKSVDMTYDECDAKFQSEGNKSIEETIDEMLTEGWLHDIVFGLVTPYESIRVFARDDKLYSVDENDNPTGYAQISIEKKTMTVEGVYDAAGTPVSEKTSFALVSYPIELTK